MQYIITFPASRGHWVYDDVVCGGRYIGNVPIQHSYDFFHRSSASSIDSYLDFLIDINNKHNYNKSEAIVKALDPVTNPELFI